MIKKVLILLILFVSSCGYKPVFVNKELNNLKFSKVEYLGETDINRKISNSLSLKIEPSNKNLDELVISSNYDIIESSKNSQGIVEIYKSIINVNLKKIKNENIIIEKNFYSSVDYNKKDTNFELVQYQSDLKKNLINNIIEQIILFLNIQ